MKSIAKTNFVIDRLKVSVANSTFSFSILFVKGFRNFNRELGQSLFIRGVKTFSHEIKNYILI